MILTVSGAEGADFAAEALADKYRQKGLVVATFMTSAQSKKSGEVLDLLEPRDKPDVVIRVKVTKSPYLTVTGMRSQT
jgi:hypothetical protein